MALAPRRAAPLPGRARRCVRRRRRAGGVRAHGTRAPRPRGRLVAAVAAGRAPRRRRLPRVPTDPPSRHGRGGGRRRLHAHRRTGLPIRLGRARPAGPVHGRPDRHRGARRDPAVSGRGRALGHRHLAARQRHPAGPARTGRRHRRRRRRARPARIRARRPGHTPPVRRGLRPAGLHRPVAQPRWLPRGAPYRSVGVEPLLGRVFDRTAAHDGDTAVVPASGEVTWRLTITANRRS